MLVVTRLAPPSLARVRVAAGAEHRVLAAGSWDELRALVRRSPAEVAVVDPCAGGSTTGAVDTAIAAVRGVVATVPVIVYAALTPASARALLSWRADGVRDVVFRGVDDEPSRFRERLEECRAPGMEEAVLGPLLAALATVRAPEAIGDALRDLFRTPRRFRSADDLVADSGLTRQHLNRSLAAAGLASAHLMVIAARVLRACQYARVPHLTIRDVATRLRYRDPRALRRHVRVVSGMTLGQWRTSATPEACLARVVARLAGSRTLCAADYPSATF